MLWFHPIPRRRNVNIHWLAAIDGAAPSVQTILYPYCGPSALSPSAFSDSTTFVAKGNYLDREMRTREQT